MTIPPHIPLEQHDPREVRTSTRPSSYIYAFIALLVGALSGFIASLLYTVYGPSTAPAVLLQQRVEHTAETIDESHIKNAQESVVAFIGDKSDQVLGYGFAITGDGWFLTPAAVAKSKHVLLHPQTAGAIEKIVLDNTSGLAFVKTTITNARVLGNASLENMPRGSTLIIALPETAIPVTLQDTSVCIADHCPSEYGDKISYAAGIVEALPSYQVDGAPVITEQGELIGSAMRINNRVVVIPVAQMRPIFGSVFSDGVVARVALPLRVVNLTRWSQFDPNNELPEQGMLVESVGWVTQIKEGDVITAIERQRIEADTSLFDLVNRPHSTDRLTVSLVRKGASLDVTLPMN